MGENQPQAILHWECEHHVCPNAFTYKTEGFDSSLKKVGCSQAIADKLWQKTDTAEYDVYNFFKPCHGKYLAAGSK